jgi:uncharacterized phage protein (TIGR01671 family)
MMRKLEFRAWADRKMIYGVGVVVSCVSGNQIVVKDGYDKIYTILDAIPMQFTGLLDKNGTKIFEGDKIQASCGTICTVEFRDCAFQVEVGGFHTVKIHSAYIANNEFEVIGNIHESIAE